MREPLRFIVADFINEGKGDHLNHLFITCDPCVTLVASALAGPAGRARWQNEGSVDRARCSFGRCVDSFHLLSHLRKLFPQRTILPFVALLVLEVTAQKII